MRSGRRCWLAEFSNVPCDGGLWRVHLVPKQLLRRAGADPWDPRSFVFACGGLVGLSGHHGLLDGQGVRPRLVIPRSRLPCGLEELCCEAGLSWWLERRYGPLEGR